MTSCTKTAVFCLACIALCNAVGQPRLILTVLQDDYGFSSPSFNRPPGQAPPESHTPSMDALASSGIILSRHYAHSFCSPTRSSFLSGRLPVHVQAENVQPDCPNAGIPAAMTTLPQKLGALGWQCHVGGKWDVGMATRAHTPEGRGFNSSLVFFSHAVDAFLQRDVDGLCGQEFVDLWDSGAPARNLNGTAYFDQLVLARMLAIIHAHDFEAAPLYLHYTPHATHNPLQAPPAYLDALNYTTNDESGCSFSVDTSPTGAAYPGGPNGSALSCRRAFEAMAAFSDSAMGALVGAIKARGLWADTLVVWQSDNGGSVDLKFGGGNNHPLRGGKATWWEGGMRVAALVGGGFLPRGVQGSRLSAMTHTADWYATLCVLAGGTAAFCAEDAPAASRGYPPIESFDLFPLLSGANGTSPRVGFAASPSAIVSGRYKLLTGDIGSASWTGPQWPNASSPARDLNDFTAHCGSRGCLFDVEADATEHVDIAATQPGVVAQLLTELAAAQKKFFSNNETGVCAHNKSLSIKSACACDAAKVVYNGFLGPYQEEPNKV
jgi:arylsulfatase B